MLPRILEALRAPYLLPAALGAALLYLVASYVLAYRRLRAFDGPWLASFSTLWMALQLPKERQGDIYYDVMRKYGGPLVRVGPNDLLTDSPDVVRRMGGARSPYRRSSWYRGLKFDPTGDTVLSTLDTAGHDRLKAKMTFGYSGKEVPDLEARIDEQVARFVHLLRDKYTSTDSDDGRALIFRPVDIGPKVSYFTLDAITSIAYGAPFGFLDADADVHSYLKIVEEYLFTVVGSCEIPFLQAIFLNKYFLRWFGPKPTDKTGMGKIMGVGKRVVAERFGPNAKDQQDMLGSFVRHGLSQDQCEQEVLLQIPAGSDTTATAIRGTLMQLCSSVSAYGKLVREIDEAVQTHHLQDRIISVELAKTLPYLQAVIYEGIRLHPPFTGFLMKEVPAGGDTIAGKFVPGGTRLGVCIKGVQMRKDVFGPDPEVFRPERFLECDDETRMRMQSTVELVFGYGRWMCAGKMVAFMELNKIYFELFRRFDFQLVNPKQPWRLINSHIYFHLDFWMKITERRL